MKAFRYIYLVHPGWGSEAGSDEGTEVLRRLRRHQNLEGFTLEDFTLVCQQLKAEKGQKPLSGGAARARLRYQYQMGNIIRRELGTSQEWTMFYLDRDVPFPLLAVKQELATRQLALEQELGLPLEQTDPAACAPALAPREKFQLVIDPEAAESIGADFEDTLRKIFG